MKRTHRGFTTLEMVVWVGLFAFTIVTIASAILYVYKTNRYTLGQAGAVSSGQRGLNSMTRVIREATYASDGAYPIISLSSSSFSFYADIDTDSSIEKVRYALEGTTLVRGVVEPAGDPPVYTGGETVSTVAEYIRNASEGVQTFTYYDKEGDLMTDYSKIGDLRYVAVNLVVDVDPAELPIKISLRSSAGIRNLVGR